MKIKNYILIFYLVLFWGSIATIPKHAQTATMAGKANRIPNSIQKSFNEELKQSVYLRELIEAQVNQRASHLFNLMTLVLSSLALLSFFLAAYSFVIRKSIIRELRNKTQEDLDKKIEVLIATATQTIHNNLETMGKMQSSMKEKIDEQAANFAVQHMVNESNILLLESKYDQALRTIEEVIRIEPKLAKAHSIKGVILNRTGKRSAAIVAYMKAIEIDKNAPEYHYNLGNTFHDMKNFEKAMEAYQTARSLIPNDVEILFNTAITLEDMDRIDEAIDTYKTALTYSPDYADAHYNLACLFSKKSDIRQAALHLESAFSLSPALTENAMADLDLHNLKEDPIFTTLVGKYGPNDKPMSDPTSRTQMPARQ